MAKIIAIVTTSKDNVVGGGAPVFVASGLDDLQNLANLAEKILDCTAHQLHETLFMIVDHHSSG